MRITRSEIRKSLAYKAGYWTAKAFDSEGMPLEMSIGKILLIGSISILLLLGGYKWL